MRLQQFYYTTLFIFCSCIRGGCNGWIPASVIRASIQSRKQRWQQLAFVPSLDFKFHNNRRTRRTGREDLSECNERTFSSLSSNPGSDVSKAMKKVEPRLMTMAYESNTPKSDTNSTTEEELSIDWMDLDITGNSENTAVVANDDTFTVPLYPIRGAVYVPTSATIREFNNVQPSTKQLVMDVTSAESSHEFCVVLQAFSSSSDEPRRIAKIGTIMEIIKTEYEYGDGRNSSTVSEQQRDDVDAIRRIKVFCRAKQLVRILSVVKEDQPTTLYPVVQVQSLSEASSTRSDFVSTDDSLAHQQQQILQLQQQIMQDYNHVRDLYLNGIEQDLPPFAIPNLAIDLPPMVLQNLTFTGESFWYAAEIWQTLCETVRVGKQIRWSSERNERLVSSASKLPGVMNLPVKLYTLPLDDQRMIAILDDVHIQNWQQLQLDPSLDFQMLLQLVANCCTDDPSQLQLQLLQSFYKLIHREHQRMLRLQAFQYGLNQQQPQSKMMVDNSTFGEWE